VHVADHGRLAEVEADHVRHVGVDGLVVGDARADGIRDGDASLPIRGEQSRHPEHGVRPKHQRIEEVIVDAAVDDIDPLRALGGAHVHRLVAHEQVLPFDQLDAHLLREEGVLEIGAVVGAGGQQHHGGIGDTGRGDAAQVFEQHLGIALDGGDAVLGEELGEQPHHHLAVLEHVGDARGHAQIVLEHPELAGIVADDVDARDVRVDAAGDVDALHFRAVLGIAEHLLGGNDAGLQDLLVMVDVVDEGVEGADALLEAVLETNPLLGRKHPGHDVERDQPFGAFFLAVDRERDTDAVEEGVRLGALLRQALGGLSLQPLGVTPVVGARRTTVRIHFIIGGIDQIDPRLGH
jgi:hypothetical protein